MTLTGTYRLLFLLLVSPVSNAVMILTTHPYLPSREQVSKTNCRFLIFSAMLFGARFPTACFSRCSRSRGRGNTFYSDVGLYCVYTATVLTVLCCSLAFLSIQCEVRREDRPKRSLCYEFLYEFAMSTWTIISFLFHS